MTVRPFLIANHWVQGGGEPFSSLNPANGQEVARIASASAADVDSAVGAARAALGRCDWASLKHHERARFLTRISDLITGRADQLARLQSSENGKTLRECRAQVASAAATFRYYAAVCETFESEITTQRGPSMTMTVYEPVGVVAAITPWNSPLTLEAQKLAPILAAGNTVVLKPSEVTPQIALSYAEIALEAGLPAGVLNVVTGAGDVGRALVEHPGVDMISFTGGTAAGRAIAASAGQRLKPVILELGGKSPNIVFADADLAAAVAAAADGIFSGGGQSCVAGSRVFVERSILEPFLERMTAHAQTYVVGPPEDETTSIGPMASLQHRDFVARTVRSGLEEGGRVVTGGEVPTGGVFDEGAYYPATIVTGVTNQARISREEIFGPVAVVLPFDGEADLIAQANDSDFGLAAGIWTGDYRKAWRVARALRAGTVWINTYKELSISTPFGGFKQSGIGREKGTQGMRAYMEPKGVFWHMG
jgi:acyl-CoA reductase-like NAD-dependent aldehyde dehydrogenase